MLKPSTLKNLLLAVPIFASTAALISPAGVTAAEPLSASALPPSLATSPVLANAAPADLEEGIPSLNLSDVYRSVNLVEEAEPTPAVADIDQVTSVSQLTDVKPTDWAFQALQSLVERYGCIVGYPDRTFRGNRAITRYEFAAGLNACMDRVNELIAAATADLVKKEDLQALQKLAEEFAAELATLRGRVDGLTARVETLEKQQFSTTTKLSGLVWFNLTGAAIAGDDGVIAERGVPDSATPPPTRDRVTRVPSRVVRGEPNLTFSNYVWLTLNTSFTGKDSLITQLVSGNGNSPANQLVSAGYFNSWGTPFLDQSGIIGPPNSVVIRELSYAFPVGTNFRLVVGPRINFYRYLDNNRFTTFINGATSFNSNGSTLSNAVDRGSGAVAIWTINPQFRFTAAYLGENTEFLNPAFGFNTSSNPSRGNGLFGGTYTITGELAYSPSSTFNLRLLYTRSRLKAYNGFVGGAAGEPLPYGYADDGFGGQVYPADANAFVVNFDWLITKGFGIFGRYSYGNTQIEPINPTRADGEVNVQSIQFGLGFPDLGKKGALGVISFVVPQDYLEGRRFLLSGAGDGSTQYELEASYFYPITRNIAIVPAVYAIFNPNNFGDNPTVLIGNIRSQFSF